MANKLGKELFELMQGIQGNAFISDSVETLSDERVLELAARKLEWQKEGVKVLREFLKTHLTKRAADGQYLCERCGYPESAHPNKKCAAFARR